MTTLSIYFIIIPIVSGLLLFINLLFSVHIPDHQKVSPFECGFTGFEQTRVPFSISFYLIGILFLIFDLELALIYPFLISFSNNSYYGLWLVIIFLAILTVGFIYEFSKNALNITNFNKYNHNI